MPADESAHGVSMSELLRVKRRISRFGGAERPKYTPPYAKPHFSRDALRDARAAGRGASETVWSEQSALGKPVAEHAWTAVDEDETIMAELSRRSSRAPGEKKQDWSGKMVPVVGTWPHDEYGTRPDAGEHAALLPVDDDADASSVGATVVSASADATREDGGKSAQVAAGLAAIGNRDDGDFMRFASGTQASAAKARGRKPPPGYTEQPDAILDPIERTRLPPPATLSVLDSLPSHTVASLHVLA